MKKLISLFLLSSMLGVPAMADTFVAHVSKDQFGRAASAEFAGYNVTRIYSATEAIVCTGRCVLAGVLPSTGAAATLVSFYDTSVAGALAAAELKYFSNFDTSQTGTATTRAGHKPMRFSKGISVKLSSVSAGESVSVLWIDLDAQ
jgi:hypothetical protein